MLLISVDAIPLNSGVGPSLAIADQIPFLDMCKVGQLLDVKNEKRRWKELV